MVFNASGSSDRSTQSLLEAMTRVAPPAVRKISIPFVMPFSLVVTRWLRALAAGCEHAAVCCALLLSTRTRRPITLVVKLIVGLPIRNDTVLLGHDSAASDFEAFP